MSTQRPPPNDHRPNGHTVIDGKAKSGTVDHGPNEPTGLPTSDRYNAETAHAPETHDATKKPADDE